MYDMYPSAWSEDDAQLGSGPVRPRRRPRRAHSVLPAVIVRQLAAAEARRALA